MSEFGVLLIAVDRYPHPPGTLPSSTSARRFATILCEDRGGVLIESIVAGSEEEIRKAFRRWAGAKKDRPLSSIVYLVGHGTADGVQHSFLVPESDGDLSKLKTVTLAEFFEEDWFRREPDGTSWMLFVLDCCDSTAGTTNLTSALTQSLIKAPGRLSLWPVTPDGASHSGAFVDAFDRAASTFNENDAAIPLNEVLRRMRPDLGDLRVWTLPDDAALDNPLHSQTPVVMSLDTHGKLRSVVAALSAEVRNHFLTKAQGGESGDLAWYFCGRDAEIAVLSAWLRDESGGMRVVTGEAGSGKSALLGHLVVLSDDRLRDAYITEGLAADLARSERPPSYVFTAALQLTGRTLAQTLRDFHAQAADPAGSVTPWATPAEAMSALRRRTTTVTILADALDEAQEPMEIADFLRQAASAERVRVLVGTRRSLSEGPDRPAAPDRRELLDALGIADDGLVVIERDPEATKRYVHLRLAARESPYAGRGPIVDTLAERIASMNQPFLFARLAVSELLARRPLAPDVPELGDLLEHGHRGVFIAALSRLTAEDRDVVIMLRALALARGRGVPESGDTWLAMAHSMELAMAAPDTAVRRTLDRAAPYVMLDGEAGQSVYRLAHRTFAEHFRSERYGGVEHRRAAEALRALVTRSGGWPSANYYAVRYLSEHFTAEPETVAPDADGLSRLATDPGWLIKAMKECGVDILVDTLATARRTAVSPLAETVERVLRRSRIPLSRNARQLPGQLHARLRTHPDPRFATLGDAVANAMPGVWLRMRDGTLDWQADLETTYGLVGKIRALAFGEIEDRPIVAIGIDKAIHLWDPRRGSGGVQVVNCDGQVTALALSVLRGRPVIASAIRHPTNFIVVYDARTGAAIDQPIPVPHAVDSMALGRLGDRMAIAAYGLGKASACDAGSGISVPDVPALVRDKVLGVAVLRGALVGQAVRPLEAGFGCWVVDLATGADLWPEPRLLRDLPRMIAGGAVGEDFALAAASRSGYEAWRAAEPGYTCAYRQDSPDGIRAVAIGAVEGQLVVAHAPDFDTTTLVSLSVASAAPARHGTFGVALTAPRGALLSQDSLRSIRAFAALADRDATAPAIVALSDDPVALVALSGDAHGDTEPTAETVTFALTGVAGSELDFRNPTDRRRLISPPPLGRVLPPRFDIKKPLPWPRTATARGFVDGRRAVVTGSILGSAWLWSEDATRVIAGPFGDAPEGRKSWGSHILKMKGGANEVTSVALGHHPVHGDLLAIACAGRVRLVALASGSEIPTPTSQATVITSVALGRLLGKHALVTGSQGGVVIVWDLESNSRMTGLTLDRGIERVWVVHGTDAIAVRTGAYPDAALFVLDVRGG